MTKDAGVLEVEVLRVNTDHMLVRVEDIAQNYHVLGQNPDMAPQTMRSRKAS